MQILQRAASQPRNGYLYIELVQWMGQRYPRRRFFFRLIVAGLPSQAGRCLGRCGPEWRRRLRLADSIRHAVSFAFGGILCRSNCDGGGGKIANAAASPLLSDVSQFMRQQSNSRRAVGRVLPAREHNIVSDGVGQRMNSLRRSCAGAIHMNAHSAEVVAEARFHPGARG
jgi:hypothetical protein